MIWLILVVLVLVVATLALTVMHGMMLQALHLEIKKLKLSFDNRLEVYDLEVVLKELRQLSKRLKEME